jgi:hypothetical protein
LNWPSSTELASFVELSELVENGANELQRNCPFRDSNPGSRSEKSKVLSL